MQISGMNTHKATINKQAFSAYSQAILNSSANTSRQAGEEKSRMADRLGAILNRIEQRLDKLLKKNGIANPKENS
jgi:hypothetical protein